MKKKFILFNICDIFKKISNFDILLKKFHNNNLICGVICDK